MKKTLLILGCVLFVTGLFAQDGTETSTPKKKIDPRHINLSGRANDHLVIQLGYAAWGGAQDTLKKKGLPRTFNMYFMFDFPFKSDTRFSVGIGPGIATDNVYLNKTVLGIADNTSSLSITNVSNANHFKKYKVGTAWLEVPVELRFSMHPDDPKKTFKAAIGAKVGALLSAWTKGRLLQNSSNATINNYTEKLKSKEFFTKNRLSLTGRVGYGNLSLFGSYSFTPLFKQGTAPAIYPFSIGITLSGL